MSGGIAQLVAVGAQDAHLVGNPEVSFFRSSYKRHTNFSHVVDRQVIQGNPSNGGMSTIRFERKGDMLGYVYLTRKNASGVAQVFSPTDIDKVELVIGGQVIDDQSYEFSNAIASSLLSSTFNKSNFQAARATTGNLFYPLRFWFCENWQSALPLVALQYHDVELRVTWGSSISGTYECWADFIYLDTVERQELVTRPINMLIYQVQKAIQSGNKTQELNFNHPVKFLSAAKNLITPDTFQIKLQINGIDVGDFKSYDPHYNMISYYYHVPGNTTEPIYGNGFLYPFCLDTTKLQPTGTLNFSRLDSARLVTDDPSGFDQTPVYAVNYNVLKIQNGMGGLMYAN
jgi:hypothetical protein